MITSTELREKFLRFFGEKGHTIIPSASLIPENDPTVLFTTAGMHPLVPYLLGEQHPSGTRLADVQKCIRTVDIDGVGDNSHLTFFEMLGNWSLGDYFKEEAIQWSWEFLTDKKWLGIDSRKLSVTVFGGDAKFPDLGRDKEAAKIWLSAGVPEQRIAYMPGGVLEREDNWWGPAGQTGPCGPSTEMFYWQGETEFPSSGSNPNNDQQNWLEIWNDVFMQYNRREDNTFTVLKKRNVDTGMGLDRTIRILNGYNDIFQIDTFWPLIQKIESLCEKDYGWRYGQDENITKSMRIIADHVRTATMIMADDRGIVPSNVDQGYVVRRLIRRAVRYARQLGLRGKFCAEVARAVVAIFRDVYPEVERNKEKVFAELAKEEEKFDRTLEKGIKEFERIWEKKKAISGEDAFLLYSTYGFPLELSQELAQEQGQRIDEEKFRTEFRKHQDLSRAGAKQKFHGGLADHSWEVIRQHTATHLLHQALRDVLGDHVFQRGSNITKERLRFDFSHGEKMTPEQLALVEEIVNEQVRRDLPVHFEMLAVDEAKTRGAIGLFEDKYAQLGNTIKVYFMGDYSKEICGGPHVEHTGQVGKLKIVKEEAVSQGVRRIKAIVE